MSDDPNQTADQVADLQAQMDQTRAECIRPVIMDHINRYMRAKSMTDKYHEMESLITFSMNYIDDENTKDMVLKDLDGVDVNFSSDFVMNYKAEIKVGVPWHIILENEYRKLLPRLRRVWVKVQKSLVEQGLIPWTLTYPEKMLEGALIDEVITEIQMQKFRRSTESHDTESRMGNMPPMALPTVESDEYDEFDEDDTMEDEGVEDEEPSTLLLPKLSEPKTDRYNKDDDDTNDDEDDDDDEPNEDEIEKGAEIMKRMLGGLNERRNSRED